MSIKRGQSTLGEALGPDYDLATWFQREYKEIPLDMLKDSYFKTDWVDGVIEQVDPIPAGEGGGMSIPNWLLQDVQSRVAWSQDGGATMEQLRNESAGIPAGADPIWQPVWFWNSGVDPICCCRGSWLVMPLPHSFNQLG